MLPALKYEPKRVIQEKRKEKKKIHGKILNGLGFVIQVFLLTFDSILDIWWKISAQERCFKCFSLTKLC